MSRLVNLNQYTAFQKQEINRNNTSGYEQFIKVAAMVLLILSAFSILLASYFISAVFFQSLLSGYLIIMGILLIKMMGQQNTIIKKA